MELTTNCRETAGILVGLIDAMITLARVLRTQNVEYNPAVIEALRDLASDEDLAWVLERAKELSK